MTKPEGTYYPLDLLPENESTLPDFKWVEQWRPKSPQDIFRWKDGSEEEGRPEIDTGTGNRPDSRAKPEEKRGKKPETRTRTKTEPPNKPGTKPSRGSSNLNES